MKIALCFYGFMRFFTQTHSFWKENFLDKADVDVYISTWDTESYKTKNRGDIETNGFESGVLLDLHLVRELYNPVGLRVDVYDKYHDKFVDHAAATVEDMIIVQKTHPDGESLVRHNRPVAHSSMCYKWSTFFYTWEEQLFDYDMIFLTRSDFIFMGDVTTLKPNTQSITTSPWPNGRPEKQVNYDIGMNDWWMFGTPEVMKCFCDLYYVYETVRNLVKEEHGKTSNVNPFWESTNIHGLPYQNMIIHGYSVEKLEDQLGILQR